MERGEEDVRLGRRRVLLDGLPQLALDAGEVLTVRPLFRDPLRQRHLKLDVHRSPRRLAEEEQRTCHGGIPLSDWAGRDTGAGAGRPSAGVSRSRTAPLGQERPVLALEPFAIASSRSSCWRWPRRMSTSRGSMIIAGSGLKTIRPSGLRIAITMIPR